MSTFLAKTAGFAGFVAQVAAITHCTFEYLFDFVICSGPSMEPTLYSNNVLMTDRLSVKLGRVHSGDIVIAKNPTKPTQLICKRVLGTPGDVMLAEDPSLFDAALPEEEREIRFRKVIIPPGHIWLEGDNSSNSSDSRNFGPVPKGLVQSRVIFRLLPVKSMGTLTN